MGREKGLEAQLRYNKLVANSDVYKAQDLDLHSKHEERNLESDSITTVYVGRMTKMTFILRSPEGSIISVDDYVLYISGGEHRYLGTVFPISKKKRGKEINGHETLLMMIAAKRSQLTMNTEGQMQIAPNGKGQI